MSLSYKGDYNTVAVKLAGTSGTVTASGGNSYVGPYPASQTMSDGQTVTFYIYTLQGSTQGTYPITFTSPCGSTATLTLTVTK